MSSDLKVVAGLVVGDLTKNDSRLPPYALKGKEALKKSGYDLNLGRSIFEVQDAVCRDLNVYDSEHRPVGAAVALRCSPAQLPEFDHALARKPMTQGEKSSKGGVLAGGMVANAINTIRTLKGSATGRLDYEFFNGEGGSQMLRTPGQIFELMEKGELEFRGHRKQKNKNGEIEQIELHFRDIKDGKIYAITSTDHAEISSKKLPYLKENWPEFFDESKEEKFKKHPKYPSSFELELNHQYAFFEVRKIKKRQNGKLKEVQELHPAFVDSAKGELGIKTTDCDGAFLGIPLKLLSKSKEAPQAYNSGLPYKPVDEKIKTEQKQLAAEVSELLTSHVPSMASIASDAPLGIVHPFEALFIRKTNELYKTKQYAELQDKTPSDESANPRESVVDFIKDSALNMMQHGFDNHTPKKPESLNAPILHLWKGEYFLTTSEKQLIKFVLQPGYLEHNYIHIHPEWNMELWAPVVARQLLLERPMSPQLEVAFVKHIAAKTGFEISENSLKRLDRSRSNSKASIVSTGSKASTADSGYHSSEDDMTQTPQEEHHLSLHQFDLERQKSVAEHRKSDATLSRQSTLKKDTSTSLKRRNAIDRRP